MAKQRLIDVNKLISDYGMSTDCDDCKRKSECDYALLMWRDVCAMLDDAPTVDAVPIAHAHWELVEEVDSFTGLFTCSVCKYQDEHSFLGNVPFCWHCGARMDEGGGSDVK